MFFMGYILVLTEELFRFNSISIFLYEMTNFGFQVVQKGKREGEIGQSKKKNR